MSATGLEAAEASGASVEPTSGGEADSEFALNREAWPLGADRLLFADATGIDVELNPAAGRSPSKPEPAKFSPPKEDRADLVGTDSGAAPGALPFDTTAL